ncbi:MAG: hypothetical protein WAL28_01270 [Nitrososphaeraceae archaeon]|jgi:hypothetical protein
MNYKLVHSIITTMSIALVMIIMIISNGATQSNAAKLNSLNDWCYVSAFPEDHWVCFQDREQCDKAYASDLFKFDSCLKDSS